MKNEKLRKMMEERLEKSKASEEAVFLNEDALGDLDGGKCTTNDCWGFDGHINCGDNDCWGYRDRRIE